MLATNMFILLTIHHTTIGYTSWENSQKIKQKLHEVLSYLYCKEQSLRNIGFGLKPKGRVCKYIAHKYMTTTNGVSMQLFDKITKCLLFAKICQNKTNMAEYHVTLFFQGCQHKSQFFS